MEKKMTNEEMLLEIQRTAMLVNQVKGFENVSEKYLLKSDNRIVEPIPDKKSIVLRKAGEPKKKQIMTFEQKDGSRKIYDISKLVYHQ